MCVYYHDPLRASPDALQNGPWPCKEQCWASSKVMEVRGQEEAPTWGRMLEYYAWWLTALATSKPWIYNLCFHPFTESLFLNPSFHTKLALTGLAITKAAPYTHVFALQPLHFLNHDILQDLVVEDLSQLQTLLCKVWNNKANRGASRCELHVTPTQKTKQNFLFLITVALSCMFRVSYWFL